jgi:hypothetical protein
MLPRSPPRAKKVIKAKPVTRDSDDSDDGTSEPVEAAPKKRSPRRATKAPANYIEISSEGDWDGGDDGDDSFVID